MNYMTCHPERSEGSGEGSHKKIIPMTTWTAAFQPFDLPGWAWAFGRANLKYII